MYKSSISLENKFKRLTVGTFFFLGRVCAPAI